MELQYEAEIVEVVEKTYPNLLVIALDKSDKRSPLCDILLRRYREMKILAVALERNSSMFFWVSFDIHESPAESSETGTLNRVRLQPGH